LSPSDMSFFFSSRRRHTRSKRDWSSDVCSSDLTSVATVVMAFDEEQVKNTIEGTGFVISRNMGTSITACTWTNKKWEHSTPEGKALLRAYVGRPGDFIVHEKSDEDIVRLAREDLDKIMDLDGAPEFTIVTR